MSLHFSLVVCYCDNKGPFDARRPFYLQISLLNVINVRARVCVCVRAPDSPLEVRSFSLFFNCCFSATYTQAFVRIIALIL